MSAPPLPLLDMYDEPFDSYTSFEESALSLGEWRLFMLGDTTGTFGTADFSSNDATLSADASEFSSPSSRSAAGFLLMHHSSIRPEYTMKIV
jgi:hypothetical protein